MAQREIIKTIRLKTPVTLGERTIEELNIARPKTRDLLRLDAHTGGQWAAEIALLSSLTGEPEELLYEIDCEDYPLIHTQMQMLWLSYFVEPGAAASSDSDGGDNGDNSKKKNT